jgi:hypothetical protein
MRHPRFTRVLAIDLHPRCFGYVIVESPDRLLDWGARSHRHKGDSGDALIRRLRSLLELWRPSLLVINSPRQIRLRKNVSRKRLFERVTAEAKNHRVSVRGGSEQVGNSTKYEKARLVAEQFPALRWNLPAKRKPWESESYRMSTFSAATLAMAQLNIKIASTRAIPRPSPPSFPQNASSPTAQ